MSGSEDDKPANDPVHGEQALSIVIRTKLWIDLLRGRTDTLTFSRIDQFPEVLIFPNQIVELRRFFGRDPDMLKPFDTRRSAFYVVTPSSKSLLETYEEWRVRYVNPLPTPSTEWAFPELWRKLSMESRYFLAKVKATGRANALLTDDPIEQEFAKLLRLRLA